MHRKDASIPILAVGVDDSNKILFFDCRGENTKPICTASKVHRAPVVAMAYNPAFHCVVSADESGTVEYWRPPDASAILADNAEVQVEKPDGVFNMKSATSLFEFKKVGPVAGSSTAFG